MMYSDLPFYIDNPKQVKKVLTKNKDCAQKHPMPKNIIRQNRIGLLICTVLTFFVSMIAMGLYMLTASLWQTGQWWSYILLAFVGIADLVCMFFLYNLFRNQYSSIIIFFQKSVYFYTDRVAHKFRIQRDTIGETRYMLATSHLIATEVDEDKYEEVELGDSVYILYDTSYRELECRVEPQPRTRKPQNKRLPPKQK